MNTNFECFVEISDQRYDLIIDGKGNSMQFSDFFLKLCEIVKIGFNEKITFTSHKFELFETQNVWTEGIVVTKADQLVKRGQTIRISRQTRPLNSSSSTSATNPISSGRQTQTDLIRDDQYLMSKEIEIKTYLSIVKSINIGWDLKSRFPNWKKVYDEVSPNDFNHFLWENSVLETAFYTWTRYYTENYFRLNNKLSQKSQEIFDSLKYVHILNLENLYHKNDPILERVQKISEETEAIDFFLTVLEPLRREKLFTKAKDNSLNQINNRQNSNSERPSLESQSIIRPTRFPENVPSVNTNLYITARQQLTKGAREIETYRDIVMAIDINLNFHGSNNTKSWLTVCKHLPKDLHHNKNLFYHWTRFYAWNFEILNGKLEPNEQKIFDSLKIVHILDLDKIYANSNQTLRKIQGFSRQPVIKDYFRKHLEKLRLKKTQSKEVVTSFRQRVSAPSVSPPNPKTNNSKTHSMQNPNNERERHKTYPASGNGRQNNRPLKEECQLIERKNDVKDFYRIVLAINIGWNLKPYDEHWTKVSETLNRKEQDLFKCSDEFFFWVRFYAQNYERLNGKIEVSSQKIFDLLKVVHTLDLRRLFSDSDAIALKITSISAKPCFASFFAKYLNDIRRIKVESKENKYGSEQRLCTQMHLSAFKRLEKLSQLTLSAIDSVPNVQNSNNSKTSVSKPNGTQIEKSVHPSKSIGSHRTGSTTPVLKRGPGSSQNNLTKRRA